MGTAAMAAITVRTRTRIKNRHERVSRSPVHLALRPARDVRERVLLLGGGGAALELARELNGRTEGAIEVVGFVAADGEAGVESLGTIEDIPAIVRGRNVDRVVVNLADARGKLPMDKLLEMKLDGVRFDHLASMYEQYTGRIAVEHLRPSWLIFSEGFRKTRLLRMAKRLVDIAG